MKINGILSLSAADLPQFAQMVDTPFIALDLAAIAHASSDKYTRTLNVLNSCCLPVSNRLRISGELLVIAYSGDKTMDYITSNLKDADIPFLSYPDKTAA